MKLGFCMWKISMQAILRGHFPSFLNSLFLRINHLWLFPLKQAFHTPNVILYITYSEVVTKIYCALKIEEILNLTIFFSL